MTGLPAFQGIVGQDRAIGLLRATLAAPRHAYLLVGPPNVGKTTVATAWARALFCRERTGCGACAECRTFDHGNYADFHVWEPDLPKDAPREKPRTGTSIDRVRELIRQTGLAPYRGDHQVHVAFVDTMRVEAANCLLKTLEEPPPGTILLLISQSVADVLPTIVSRCQRVPFSLVGEPEMAGWLEARHGVDPVQARIAARRSAGRIGYAHELVTQEDTPPRLLTATDLLEALEEADRALGLPLDRQLQMLTDLSMQARDAMILSRTGREEWLGQPEVARRLAGTGRGLDAWVRILSLLDASRQRLQAGASPKITWPVVARDVLLA